ncbi:hypothetical protein JXC34_01280 [Candidatus Woesearchaeota archaeon]|nr:hypothetical protein [Candidatus Woesearchaeota archaeon]
MASYASENRTFFYNLKRYGFSLSKNEIKQMIICVLIIAFLYSFNKWGDDTFDIVAGLTNYALGAVIALVALIVNQVGQRIVAVHYGYDPIYENAMIGLMIGLIITFASRGYIFFFLPGGINLRHLAASRLGEFRYYTNDWEWAKAGFMGPFFNVMLAVILSLFRQNPIVMQFIIVNLCFAWYSLIPLPGNLGLYLMFPHFHFWTFAVGIVATASLLLFFLNPLFTIVLSMIGGVIFIYWVYVVKHKKLSGPYW